MTRRTNPITITVVDKALIRIILGEMDSPRDQLNKILTSKVKKSRNKDLTLNIAVTKETGPKESASKAK